MIIGLHALLYSNKAAAARRFLSDVLGLPSIDSGGGWLIFAGPPAELAVHPTDSHDYDAPADGLELYLMCEDIAGTVAGLKAKGVEITRPIKDEGYGLFTALRVPGGGEFMIYEPRHPTALHLTASQKKRPKAKSKSVKSKAATKQKKR